MVCRSNRQNHDFLKITFIPEGGVHLYSLLAKSNSVKTIVSFRSMAKAKACWATHNLLLSCPVASLQIIMQTFFPLFCLFCFSYSATQEKNCLRAWGDLREKAFQRRHLRLRYAAPFPAHAGPSQTNGSRQKRARFIFSVPFHGENIVRRRGKHIPPTEPRSNG